jgi:competence protein ComEA
MRHEPSFPRLEVPKDGDLQSCPLGNGPSASTPAESIPAIEPSSRRRRWLVDLAHSVWAVPALKLLGFCCVLTCVAWLGDRSRDTTIYGPELPKQVAPESAAPTGSVPAGSVPAGSFRGASPIPDGPRTPSSPSTPQPQPPPTSPSPPMAPPCASVSTAQPTSAALPDGRLVLNEASAEELDRLPGIGKKRAEEIVALRGRLGRFKRMGDLLRVRGIGPRSLAGLKDLLVLDRPIVPAEIAAPKAPAPKPQ